MKDKYDFCFIYKRNLLRKFLRIAVIQLILDCVIGYTIILGYICNNKCPLRYRIFYQITFGNGIH